MDRIAKLERILAAEPNDPFVLYSLGQEYAKLGKFQEAISWYDRCLAADAAYAYAYYHKARALESAGDVPQAVVTLRAGLDAARGAKDPKAESEIGGYLDLLS